MAARGGVDAVVQVEVRIPLTHCESGTMQKRFPSDNQRDDQTSQSTDVHMQKALCVGGGGGGYHILVHDSN